ncbi:auxin-responsive protein IAA13-like [Cryptomeria japonica]|uniref:auxin-responsive protein IAA13-like n=1 Tax=Cryptomeria japonica TaxID=3369 RepID=UPI0025ACE9E3|nr:auxin-responsive protein IAA13-like [Cryptomeria japonica]
MDGIPIGRKVDLNAQDKYNSLPLTVEDMFQHKSFYFKNTVKDKHSNSTHWRLLDSASDYLLTYVDKDGDWMLLGDAPWENFVESVKRLRISHSTINGSSSELVGAKDYKKMNYRTRQFIDFVIPKGSKT